MTLPVLTATRSGEDPVLIHQLVTMQRSAFPPRMQVPDPVGYYRDALTDARAINIILRSASGADPVGYLLAWPQPEVCSDLGAWDPALAPDPGTLYIDLIQTLPGRRQIQGGILLLQRVCAEARRQGYRRLAAHVRTSNGLSRLMRKVFPDSRCLRRLDNWFGSGETFDYIEASPQLARSRR